jgi:hypothetical protein
VGRAVAQRCDGTVQGLVDDDRAGPGVARQGVQPRRESGSVPSAVRVVSGMVKIGVVTRPWSRSISTRWGRTSSMTSGGTRSRTMATAVPRSEAVRSSSQGTASAYLAAVVTKSHMSAAARSWVASSRLAWTTESMSGASSSAMPGGRSVERTRRTVPARGSSGVRPVARASPGRTRPSVNQCSSSGLWTRTGLVVVGRMTPERLTSVPTIELTRVDLPAPVDPPTTASSGASRDRSRGRR